MAERPSVAVAGSGRAGLACAAALAAEATVTLYERLPVAGGEAWEEPAVAALARAALAAGVRLLAGTQAIRWEGDRVLAAGESGGLFPAGALVVATGHRPRTRVELRIGGTRCAGVLAATVAAHLLDHRIRLGNHVVVAGSGAWAHEVAERVRAGGAACTVVAGRIAATHGQPRIEAVELVADGKSVLLPCDALVLAAHPVPYRNIDGAVLAAPGVVFAQRDGDAWEPEAAGRAAAPRALAAAREPREHTPTTLRIGGPA